MNNLTHKDVLDERESRHYDHHHGCNRGCSWIRESIDRDNAKSPSKKKTQSENNFVTNTWPAVKYSTHTHICYCAIPNCYMDIGEKYIYAFE
jgi:hypothetical protein